MWHDHDIDFARRLRLHRAMSHVALESWQWIHQVAAPCNVIRGPAWHATEFVQTSAILEFYIWFRFWPYHCSLHVILHQSVKFYPNRATLCRNKWRHVDFHSAILDFRGPIMGSLKSPCTTSYRSSIDTIALNCLVFEKIVFFCILATDRQMNRWTASMH